MRVELPEKLCQRYIGTKLNVMGPEAPADAIRATVEMMVEITQELRQDIKQLEHMLTEKRTVRPTTER